MSSMNNFTAKEKIIKARIELLRAHPFWGTMAMHLRPIELTGEDIQKTLSWMPTIAVDEYGNMPYNKDFIDSKTLEEVMFFVAHETMHIALEHIWRMGSRDPQIANMAADFAANYILGEEMNLPQGVLGYNDNTFKDKSFEEIYEELIKDAKKYRVKYQGKSFDSMIPSNKKDSNGQEIKSPFWKQGQEKLDATKMVKDAISFAKNQGHLPAGVERIFKEYFTTNLNWKELLLKYIQEVLPKDFTYMKPSKRFASTEVYVPSIVKQEIEIICGIDSSGSISDREYTTFLSELATILNTFENIRGTALICDAEIQDIIEINRDFDPYSIHGHGYGGTSCIPIFRWIKEERGEGIKLLIYFTDGFIDEPTEEVYSGNYPVLWVVTSRGRTDFLKENIGKQTIIQMDDEGED